MSGRAEQILGRFPNHLDAARPGKRLGAAVDALALDLDVLAARMAAVRRAHRLSDADELVDLLRIADLHGLKPGELELLFMRFARGRVRLALLAAAASPVERDAAAEALLALWGLDAVAPRLPLFAPAAAPADLDAARDQLLAAARPLLGYDALCSAVRGRIGRACAIHANGNGTVQALLDAAANALDLEPVGAVVHSEDRYWHAVAVRDRLRLARPAADANAPPEPLAPASELLGIEENPLYRAETDAVERHHGERFTLSRRGFGRALLQLRISGLAGGRTLGPCLVNRDEGHGVGYTGAVPEGSTLVLTEEGRALLDGADVTASAYAWQGACFADAVEQDLLRDFCFAGDGLAPLRRPAAFVTMTRPAAIDRETVDPGAGDSLPMPGIAVGQTRFACFVQEAAFNTVDASTEPDSILLVTPRTRAAVLDGSVFAAAAGEPPAAPAMKLQLSWLEHRAYAVRLLIPPRFRTLDEQPDALEVLRRVGIAINRYRPLGVAVTVEFIDNRWVLGTGALSSGVDDDAIEQLRSATALWQAPAPAVPV